MKKILSVILSVCMIFALLSLSACNQNPAAVVDNAVEKTENLDSYEAVMELKVSMSATGIEMEIPMTITLKADGMNGEKPKVSTTVDMSMFGQETSMEVYVEGDWAYIVDEDGEGYKINIDDDALEAEYDYSEMLDSVMQELPEELFKNVKFVSNSDGSKTVSVEIPDSVFNQLFEDFAESMEGFAGEISGDVVISNAAVDITVDDGYVSVYGLEYTMEATVMEMSATVGVEAKITYVNPGENVTVTPPEGYKDFTSFGY